MCRETPSLGNLWPSTSKPGCKYTCRNTCPRYHANHIVRVHLVGNVKHEFVVKKLSEENRLPSLMVQEKAKAASRATIKRFRFKNQYVRSCFP